MLFLFRNILLLNRKPGHNTSINNGSQFRTKIWQTFLFSHKLVRRIVKEVEQEKELSAECKVDVKAYNCWKEPCNSRKLGNGSGWRYLHFYDTWFL